LHSRDDTGSEGLSVKPAEELLVVLLSAGPPVTPTVGATVSTVQERDILPPTFPDGSTDRTAKVYDPLTVRLL
jgi:hypothetical protein